MEFSLSFLQNQFPIILEHKYLFLFLGSMLEGLNTFVLGGFLISIGKLNFWPTFSVFVIGYSINGFIWYGVGYFAGAKPIDKWLRSKPSSQWILERVQKYFQKYSGRAIVITKSTLSLTVTTLILAGSLKYNLKQFGWYNFLGSVGWVIITVTTGYFFGESYKLSLAYIKDISIALIFVLFSFMAMYFIRMTFRSAFLKSLIMTDRIKEFSYKIRDGMDKFLSTKTSRKDDLG